MPTLVEDYINYTSQAKKEYGYKTVVLLQCGSFFEMYGVGVQGGDILGSSIVDASEDCSLRIATKAQSITLSGKALKIVQSELPEITSHCTLEWYQSGFQLAYLEKYLALLMQCGWTVPVYEQTKADPMSTEGKFLRELSQVYTPGTTFLDDDVETSNRIACIWVSLFSASIVVPYERVMYGCATIDIYSGDVHVGEYHTQKEQAGNLDLSDVVQFVTSEHPRELRLVVTTTSKTTNTSSAQLSVRDALVSALGSMSPSIRLVDADEEILACQKQTVQETVLRRFFPEFSTPDACGLREIRDRETACSAFIYLLSALSAQCPNLALKLKQPRVSNSASRLSLPNHSLQQLGVYTGGSDTSLKTVLGMVLKKTSTAVGRRRITRQLLSPSTLPDTMESHYNKTTAVLQCSADELGQCRALLRRVCDVEKAYRKLVMNRADLHTIAQLISSVQTISDTLQWVTKLAPSVSAAFEVEGASDSIDAIQTCLQNYFGSGADIRTKNFTDRVFSDLCCEDLKMMCDTREHKSTVLDAVNQRLDTILGLKASKKGGSTVEVVRPTNGAPFFQTTQKRAATLISKAMPIRFAGAIAKEEASTISFSTSEIVAVSRGSSSKRRLQHHVLDSFFSELGSLTADIEAKNKEVFGELVAQLQGMASDFIRISSFIGCVDELITRATVATSYGWCCPIITTTPGTLELCELRHPLIEQMQLNELYVPNDVVLSGQENGMLLFGTNAVGKSSLVKSVGIAVVLAQAGFYVPATSMTFCPFTRLFTRILGNDDMFRGLSTFAVEMNELDVILRNADKQSLVLGDELCSGTETTSAVAVFSAGLEHLAAVKATFMFATHLHEIARMQQLLKLDSVQFKHLAVNYDEGLDTLQYVRKLRDGPGNAVYGLEVCRALHMPDAFTERAGQIRRILVGQESSVISQRKSRYNSRKVVGTCERCGKASTETHHLQHQVSAVGNSRKTATLHNTANLMALCDSCHNMFHSEGGEHRRERIGSSYKVTSVSE